MARSVYFLLIFAVFWHANSVRRNKATNGLQAVGEQKWSNWFGNFFKKPAIRKVRVDANGLKFSCRTIGKQTGNNSVMLLHGFPYWSSFWNELMEKLAEEGYHCFACNQRGYSSGARPNGASQYNYNKLRDDVFAIAAAFNVSRYHVVSHDHGSVLGWYSASDSRGKEQFLSFTAMSIPHLDVFSKALYGPEKDMDQVVASQYFQHFVKVEDNFKVRAMFYNTLGLTHGFTPSAFYKALLWYNGAFDVGVLAKPPLLDEDTLDKLGQSLFKTLRGLRGGEGNDGAPQKVATGYISMPTLYVCGSQDPAILCYKDWALKTKDYVPESKYTYVEVNCGHNPLDKWMCRSGRHTVMDAVLKRIQSA
eukprot:TRINITY_DN4937_c0_g1_i4.p1 TRINITY_DN4937_c0_g1~~TRINITY_DN4937_c0_g1_i4.p1  ORF type:complete len:383 (-),score=36.71 TRINITY_DN4937_c0_g1_i4:163-1251(-)